MPSFGAHSAQGRSSDSITSSDSDIGGSIENNLKQAQAGVQDLIVQLNALREDNKKLKSDLKSAKDAHRSLGSEHPASDDDINLESLKRVRSLERTVEGLRAENHRQLRRLEKFKAKQIEAELEDLKGGPRGEKSGNGEQEVDPEYRMRKLLRKFTDLMMVTTIPADFSQTCPICIEKFQLNHCSALQCQHLICNECLPQISKGADETVKCPECRRFTSRGDIELVHMTEEERWDELLGVAHAWDAFDVRGEEETTEEENEENFFNDATESSDASHEMRNAADAHSSSEMEEISADNAAASKRSTPPPSQGRLYSESPMKEKRKRMEELAGRAKPTFPETNADSTTYRNANVCTLPLNVGRRLIVLVSPSSWGCDLSYCSQLLAGTIDSLGHPIRLSRRTSRWRWMMKDYPINIEEDSSAETTGALPLCR